MEMGPLSEDMMKKRYIFISNDQHSSVTPENLNDRWCISVAQVSLTLKATTRLLVRSALVPLARHYQVDHMFQVYRIQGNMATGTIDTRCDLIHRKRY